MPIMSENPTPVLPKPEEQVRQVIPAIEPKTYRSCLVTSSKVKLGSLLQYISGTDYLNTYYSQVLGADESPQPFDINQTASYQQYYRIKTYIMRLQGSLNNSFSSDTNQLTISGTALMLPGVVPNRGDCFVSDIGNGRLGLFSVEDVTPMTYRDGSVYEITFKMIDYYNQVIEDNLEEKVVASYVFDRAALQNDRAPIVTEDEYNLRTSITELYRSLIPRYLNDFYSREYSTLLVGGQDWMTTYDYYATKAFLSVTNVKDDPRIRSIQLFNIGDYNYNEEPSLWDMLIRRDNNLRDQAFQEYRSVSTSSFHVHPAMKSIRYTGVKMAVIPRVRHESVDSTFRGDIYGETTVDFPNVSGTQYSTLGEGFNYVLGKDFFGENIRNSTAIADQLVHRVLLGESIPYKELLDFSDGIKRLPSAHRYYLQLLLIILIKLETDRACEC